MEPAVNFMHLEFEGRSKIDEADVGFSGAFVELIVGFTAVL